jgi:hypothetical protein
MALVNFQKNSATLARAWELTAANLATTLFQDQAATTAVDTNGQSVRAWKSIDASNTTMSCSATGNSYVASSHGGLPFVQFANAERAGIALSFTGYTPPDSGSTIIALVGASTGSFSDYIVSGPALGPTDWRHSWRMSNLRVARETSFSTETTRAGTTLDRRITSGFVVTIRTRNLITLGNASQVEEQVRINGQLLMRRHTVLSGSGTGNTWYVGGTPSPSRAANHRINTLAFYSGWLSDAECLEVEQYLAGKLSPALPIVSMDAPGIADVNIIATGNSILNGAWLPEGIPLDIQLKGQLGPNTMIYNLGIGGQTTAQMITRAATNEDVLSDPAKFNILLYQEGGGNDACAAGSPETFTAIVDTYLRARKASGKYQHIIAMSPTDRTAGHSSQASFNANRAAIAAKLDALVAEGVIDQHVNMVGDTSVVDGDTFYIRPIGANGLLSTTVTSQYLGAACTPDNIHINGNGYHFMTPPVLKALRRAITNWRNSNPGTTNVRRDTTYRYEGATLTGTLSSSGGNRFSTVTPAAG